VAACDLEAAIAHAWNTQIALTGRLACSRKIVSGPKGFWIIYATGSFVINGCLTPPIPLLFVRLPTDPPIHLPFAQIMTDPGPRSVGG
jgi:hypothetical protein